MKEKLKPCPFCGSTRIEFLPQTDHKEFPEWRLRCAECTASRTVFTKYQRQRVAEWNYRTTDLVALPKEVVDAVTRGLSEIGFGYVSTKDAIKYNDRFVEIAKDLHAKLTEAQEQA